MSNGPQHKRLRQTVLSFGTSRQDKGSHKLKFLVTILGAVHKLCHAWRCPTVHDFVTVCRGGVVVRYVVTSATAVE